MSPILEAIRDWFTNSDSPAIAAQKAALSIAGWFTLDDILKVASIVFVCLQIYFLCRDRLRKRKFEKKYMTTTKPGDLS